MDQGYYAVNICVLNFSDILLGDQLKKKMQDANVVINDRYLDVDSKGYIAFNTQHDFVEKRPEKKVISYSPTNLCGTGYNLSLIYKKGVIK